jgi:phage terminase small subunit
MGELIPAIPSIEMLPEAVQSLRTDRERLFCWSYVWNGGNGAAAARAAGYSDVKEGAKVRAHGLVSRQDILDAIGELGRRYLYSLQPKALVKLGALLDSDNERVALKAVDMTLSRTGLSERTAVDLNVNGEVRVVDHTRAAVDDLRRMKALGVPRAELERVFGFSGLSRYEKMLAADEAKLIEGTVAG